MTAYYNEHDPKKAAWLRELIAAGVIAPGIVDERSIEDVLPSELMGYAQCHFFAGIGIWSYALRQAGWPDDRPVWTGSCPCQPFSAAGKRAGTADERHLWPAFYWLISQCKPHVVFGEQVSSKDGLAWLDLVYSDLEAAGYTCGPLDLCAAGVGAPHIRQRLFFVAYAEDCDGWGGISGTEAGARSNDERGRRSASSGSTSILGDTESIRGEQGQPDDSRCAYGSGERQGAVLERDGSSSILGDTEVSAGRVPVRERRSQQHISELGGAGPTSQLGDADAARSPQRTGIGHVQPTAMVAPTGQAVIGGSPTNGFWRGAGWLYCRDGKWRPTQPGVSPLVDGTAERLVRSSDPSAPIDANNTAEARTLRLRGYGDGIVAPLAVEFIRAAMEWSA